MHKPIAYYLSAELGQRYHSSAIALIEEAMWNGTQWASPANMSPEGWQQLRTRLQTEGRPASPPLSLRHLEQFPSGTPRAEVVERVEELIDAKPLEGKARMFFLDKTEIRESGTLEFYRRGLAPMPLTFTGGYTVTSDVKDPQGQGYHVPKRELVAAVQSVLEARMFRIGSGIPNASELLRQLEEFRYEPDAKRDTEEDLLWREGPQDHLMFAVAMPIWFRTFWFANSDIGLQARMRQRQIEQAYHSGLATGLSAELRKPTSPEEEAVYRRLRRQEEESFDPFTVAHPGLYGRFGGED